MESSEDAAAAEPPTRGLVRRWRWLPTALLAAALVGAGLGAWALVAHHRTDVATTQAVESAENYALKLINFDSDTDDATIDEAMTDLLDGSTGEFKEMYDRSRSGLLQVQRDNNASARGTIVDSAVKSATSDQVVVVLFIDQSVTNHGDLDDVDIDRSRIRMTMDKVDGRWLASRVELR